VTGNWAVAAIIVSALALAAATVCILTVWRFQRLVLERQRSLEDQVGSVDEAVAMIEARLTELHSWWVASQPDESGSEGGAIVDLSAEGDIGAAIEPEIQAAIAAAAIAAAGPNARVRSATLAKSRDKASPWSQQGRVLVQSSHNLRP
jgi:hypothetical protein